MFIRTSDALPTALGNASRLSLAADLCITTSASFKLLLQFPYLIPFPLSILISTGGTLFSTFLYLSSSHQNLLIHMPLFHFLHSLMHSLQNFLFNEHSLKAIPLVSIKHFQVGYLSLSLDLNVL